MGIFIKWFIDNQNLFYVTIIVEASSQNITLLRFAEFGDAIYAEVTSNGDIHVWSELTSVEVSYPWDSLADFTCPTNRNIDFLHWCNEYLIKGNRVVSYRFPNGGGGGSQILAKADPLPDFNIIEITEYRELLGNL